jgi:hypothetical protein
VRNVRRIAPGRGRNVRPSVRVCAQGERFGGNERPEYIRSLDMFGEQRTPGQGEERSANCARSGPECSAECEGLRTGRKVRGKRKAGMRRSERVRRNTEI